MHSRVANKRSPFLQSQRMNLGQPSSTKCSSSFLGQPTSRSPSIVPMFDVESATILEPWFVLASAGSTLFAQQRSSNISCCL